MTLKGQTRDPNIRLERNISKTAGFRDYMFQRTTNKKWHNLGGFKWSRDLWRYVTLERCCEAVRSAIPATALLLVKSIVNNPVGRWKLGLGKLGLVDSVGTCHCVRDQKTRSKSKWSFFFTLGMLLIQLHFCRIGVTEFSTLNKSWPSLLRLSLHRSSLPTPTVPCHVRTISIFCNRLKTYLWIFILFIPLTF